MRFCTLSASVLLFVFFIFFACTNDEGLNQNDHLSITEQLTEKETQINSFQNLYPNVFESVSTIIQDANKNLTSIDPDSIDINNPVWVESGDSLVVFSFFIDKGFDNEFYNLVVEVKSSIIDRYYVLKYTYAKNFYRGDKDDLTQFEGTIKKLPFEYDYNKNGSDLSVEECLELVFGGGLSGGGFDPGRGGIKPTGGSDPGGSTTTQGSGSIIFEIYCIRCTCENHGCMDSCRCVPPARWGIRTIDDTFQNDTNSNKNLFDDCVSMLICAGIIPKGDPFEDGGTTQEEEGGEGMDDDLECMANQLQFLIKEKIKKQYTSDNNIVLRCCEENLVNGNSGINSECSIREIAEQTHENLIQLFPSYGSSGADLNVLTSEYGEELGLDIFLTTAHVYQYGNSIGLEPGWSKDDLLFFLEIMETTLKVGLEFIPVIGDLYAIYQSCGEELISWSCALDIVLAAFPVSKIGKIWRNWDKLKSGWKLAKNSGYLYDAWKKLLKDGDAISTVLRKNIGVLEYFSKHGDNIPQSVADDLLDNLNGKEVQEIVEEIFADGSSKLKVITESSTSTRTIASVEKTVSGQFISVKYTKGYNKSGSGLPPVSENKLAPDFSSNSNWLFPTSGGQKNIIEMKLQGSRNLDFIEANKIAKVDHLVPPGKNAPDGYIWHHMDNFDPSTGKSSFQLVKEDIHVLTLPHTGSAKQYAIYNELAGGQYP